MGQTIDTLRTPTGTSGLAVEPWTPGEIHAVAVAVAADWAQAAGPVWVYGAGGWDCDRAGRQVADFRHRVREALADVIRDAMATSAGIPSAEVDDAEVEAIVAAAVEIGDGSDDE